MLAVAEMYIKGVSTRQAEAVMRGFGIESLSSTQVSRAPELLDAELDAWRNRLIGSMKYRAIALQKPLISVRRKSLLQPAFLNLPRFDPFAGLALMMLKAIRLKAAKSAGA